MLSRADVEPSNLKCVVFMSIHSSTMLHAVTKDNIVLKADGQQIRPNCRLVEPQCFVF